MTITTAMCTSFKQELLQAGHNFSVGGANFRLALFDATATMDAATTTYSGANETTGPGYTAGGQALTNVEPATSGTTAFTDFGDVVWTGATFSARGAQIFNNSNGNKSVSVHDFGATVSVVSGNLTVSFPNATASEAILRLA